MKQRSSSSTDEILSVVPVFAGTRVLVKVLFDFLGAGDSRDLFPREVPSITREMAVAS